MQPMNTSSSARITLAINRLSWLIFSFTNSAWTATYLACSFTGHLFIWASKVWAPVCLESLLLGTCQPGFLFSGHQPVWPANSFSSCLFGLLIYWAPACLACTFIWLLPAWPALLLSSCVLPVLLLCTCHLTLYVTEPWPTCHLIDKEISGLCSQISHLLGNVSLAQLFSSSLAYYYITKNAMSTELS